MGVVSGWLPAADLGRRNAAGACSTPSPVGQAPADLLESCELGLERLGHGTAAAEAGGNSGERRHHEHGC
jgi:hypothetical protein